MQKAVQTLPLMGWGEGCPCQERGSKKKQWDLESRGKRQEVLEKSNNLLWWKTSTTASSGFLLFVSVIPVHVCSGYKQASWFSAHLIAILHKRTGQSKSQAAPIPSCAPPAALKADEALTRVQLRQQRCSWLGCREQFCCGNSKPHEELGICTELKISIPELLEQQTWDI